MLFLFLVFFCIRSCYAAYFLSEFNFYSITFFYFFFIDQSVFFFLFAVFVSRYSIYLLSFF